MNLILIAIAVFGLGMLVRTGFRLYVDWKDSRREYRRHSI